MSCLIVFIPVNAAFDGIVERNSTESGRRDRQYVHYEGAAEQDFYFDCG